MTDRQPARVRSRPVAVGRERQLWGKLVINGLSGGEAICLERVDGCRLASAAGSGANPEEMVAATFPTQHSRTASPVVPRIFRVHLSHERGTHGGYQGVHRNTPPGLLDLQSAVSCSRQIRLGCFGLRPQCPLEVSADIAPLSLSRRKALNFRCIFDSPPWHAIC